MRRQARISSDPVFVSNAAPSYLNKNNSESEDSDKDDENEPKVKKMRRSNMTEHAEEQERTLRKLEDELFQIDTDPYNPDHFERLLSYNPNSSFIWNKYMACHIHFKDLEKARTTAKRALSIIDTSEKIEKLNIWTGLLVLEELYGTKESFKQTMNEALRSNDKYQTYMKLLEIFAGSKRIKGLDELITKINRKFSDSIDAYLNCATVYFKLKKPDKARLILQKALSNLPTESHVNMICQFAWVENSDGSPEEAETLMEHVVTCYPTHIDAWCLYIDMLTKSNKIDLARRALERAGFHRLSSKKMTKLFNKWLMVEEKYGTPEAIDKVKECMDNYFKILAKRKKSS